MPSYYDQIFHRFRETSSNELIETVFVIRKIVKAEGVINDAVQLAARIWIHFFGRTNTIFRIKNTHRLDWIFVGSLACCRSIRWQMSKDQFFFSDCIFVDQWNQNKISEMHFSGNFESNVHIPAESVIENVLEKLPVNSKKKKLFM